MTHYIAKLVRKAGTGRKERIGFLLVTIFYRGGSLLPCIIVHSAINTLSTFSNKAGVTVEKHIIHALVLMFITVAYNVVLIKTLPKSQLANKNNTRDR